MKQLDFGIVAFIDILGYKSMVDSDIKNNSLSNFSKITDILNKIKESKVDENIKLKIISDSIFISTNIESTSFISLIDFVATLQRMFLLQNILIRGGIAYGKHYSDDTITYSEALINAYITESQLSRFPRILIDNNTFDHFIEQSSAKEKLKNNRIIKDRDSKYFINYLDADWIETHKEIIKKYSKTIKASQQTILEKIQWLFEYHNYSAKKFTKPEHILTDLPLSFSEVAE